MLSYVPIALSRTIWFSVSKKWYVFHNFVIDSAGEIKEWWKKKEIYALILLHINTPRKCS